MIAALLMAAAAPDTAVAAERAFAARAQVAGQWRAFAEFADQGATMFVPEPVDAHEWLAQQPEKAQAVEWSPSTSYVSCDGAMAVNTGPWWRGEAHGFFTTVWRRGAAGWRWLYDGGDVLQTARPRVAEPAVERASCAQAPISNAPPLPRGAKRGGGSSHDRSLLWSWQFDADGTRRFTAKLWTGERYRTVIEDVVASK